LQGKHNPAINNSKYPAPGMMEFTGLFPLFNGPETGIPGGTLTDQYINQPS
jgi:hypothetical protein